MIRHREIWSASLKYTDEHPSDYINEMYDIVDIEKAFKAGAKWADANPANYNGKAMLHVLEKGVEQGKREILNNLWKSADGDDLPIFDREVIVLYQPHPEGSDYTIGFVNNEYAVGFGHRPKEYWDGKNMATGEVTRYYPKRYDKGGWNSPNIKYWLDLDLPMEE